MKRILTTIFVLTWTALAFAQGSLLKQTLEITELEINNGATTISVFDMPEGDLHQYYLCVGTLGLGDDIIQFNVDPLSMLFIPLGDNLADAQAAMEEMQGIAKQPEGTELETEGVLSLANPTTGQIEPVYVTSRRFLFQKLIEFSVKREGYIRATHIAKSDFGALTTGLKMYRKLHPKLQ